MIVQEDAATAPKADAVPEELQRIAREMITGDSILGDRAPSQQVPRSSARVWLPLAAAALVAVGLSAIWKPAPPKRTTGTDVLRSLPRQDSRITVELSLPLADAVANDEQTLFSWQPIESAGRYDFVLVNEIGDLLFETSTTQSSIELPRAELALAPGSQCYWLVRATLRDGAVVESQPRAVSFQKNR